MSTSVYLGSVREVWFSTVAAPSTKYSFLVRDDSGSKGGRTFGRTIRLGDPVDTGSSSGWAQMSWEGGSGQYRWRDNQMFRDGAIDPQTLPGKARMWPGFQNIYTHYSRPCDRYVLSRGALGNGDEDTSLWMGETKGDLHANYGNPGGGWALLKYSPTNGTTQVAKFFTGPIASIAPRLTDDGTTTHIVDVTTRQAFPNGAYWTVVEDLSTTTIVQDTNAPTNGFAPDSLVSFGGATFYCQSTWLGKRVALAPYGTLGTHTKVKDIKGCLNTRGLAVWNNRLWFGVQYSGGKAMLFVSDGVSANQAVEFPEEFLIRKIVAHYGALYIAGTKPAGLLDSGNKGQIWKYTGSSLTKLWEEGDGRDGRSHDVVSMTTYGPNLVWPHHGLPSDEDDLQTWPNNRPGLMFYDAEKDAIFEGPFLDMDATSNGVFVTDVISWDNTLVVSAYDNRSYAAPNLYPNGVFYMRDADNVRMSITGSNTWGNRSFADNLTDTRSAPLTSSIYNGPDDVYNQDKVWLTTRVRVRLAQANAQIRVVAILDEDGTEQAIDTIEYDAGDTGWRTVILPMKVGGDYLSSASIQYRLYLENTSTSAASTAQAEVDSIELKWMVKPTKQRTWRIRAVCEDAQLRLAGTANPLTTAQAMADQLETLWSSATPFNLYEPQAASGGPAGSAIEVTCTDFNITQYRVEDTDTQTIQEVQMTLVEVV